MDRHKARLQEIEKILEPEVINIKKLKAFLSTGGGCPNEKGYRSLCWKLFLNYLPPEKSKWKEVLARRRNEYRDFVRDMIIRPGQKNEKDDNNILKDHPLASGPESEWDSYFQDNEVLVQIDKDVRRLCPDLFFFQKATEFPCQEIIKQEKEDDNKTKEGDTQYQSLRKRVAYTQLKGSEVRKDRSSGLTVLKNDKKKREDDSEYTHLPDGNEAHWEIVQRILFIFAKLNKGNSYVQGMNEVCGPIYYTLANDPDVEWREHAEADCFFCFVSLMGLEGVRDNFVAFLDNTEWGIQENMKRLYELVRVKDPSVYERLIKQSLRPEFFAFRWLTLLLSQEFPLPEVISLWDALFADDRLFDLLLHVCCSMIIKQRETLLSGDFSVNIKCLQSYPTNVDIQEIIAGARQLRIK